MMMMMMDSSVNSQKKTGQQERCGAAQPHGEKRTDLFVDRVALSENEVAAEQPRKKRILLPFFPTVQLPLEEQE
jgi:hypothetical protein